MQQTAGSHLLHVLRDEGQVRLCGEEGAYLEGGEGDPCMEEEGRAVSAGAAAPSAMGECGEGAGEGDGLGQQREALKCEGVTL